MAGRTVPRPPADEPVEIGETTITEAPTSWKDLLDPTYSGLISLPAMPNSGGYAFLSMLSKIAMP